MGAHGLGHERRDGPLAARGRRGADQLGGEALEVGAVALDVFSKALVHRSGVRLEGVKQG
ncbi:hypothetical protein D3C87_1793830 [compost metagenome]